MIEEVVIYHDDNGHGTRAEIQIHKTFVEICINDDSTASVVIQFDAETAYMFAKDILRKVEQIEKDNE
jgi:hypothetical protein